MEVVWDVDLWWAQGAGGGGGRGRGRGRAVPKEVLLNEVFSVACGALQSCAGTIAGRTPSSRTTSQRAVRAYPLAE